MNERDFQRGHQLAMAMLPALAAAVQTCEVPVAFWGGVISALTGMMTFSIGAEAAKTLREVSAEAAEAVAREKTN